MFGFLRPLHQDLRYRQAYVRCCQHQRLHYGTTSLLFLSYESVFAYALAVDSGAFPPPPAETPRCCRLRGGSTRSRAADADLGRYCAALGLLLGSIKLDDEVRDNGGLLARCLRWWYRKSFHQAAAFWETLDPDFQHQVEQSIADHLQLEKRKGPIPIEEYVQPTAQAFGHVFCLLARLGRPELERRRELLRMVGEQVGAALIAFDCAADWQRDQVRGDFNPLPDLPAANVALGYCRARLDEAARLCVAEFGPSSLAAAVLWSRRQRVAVALRANPAAECARTLEGWGLFRQKGYIYLGMDCPDCSGCDCSGCDCGGGDAGGGDCGGCDGGSGADTGSAMSLGEAGAGTPPAVPEASLPDAATGGSTSGGGQPWMSIPCLGPCGCLDLWCCGDFCCYGCVGTTDRPRTARQRRRPEG